MKTLILLLLALAAPQTTYARDSSNRKARSGECHFEVKLASLNITVGEDDEKTIGFGNADCVDANGIESSVAFYVREKIEGGVFVEAMANFLIGTEEMDAGDVLGSYSTWDADLNTGGLSPSWMSLENESNGRQIDLFGLYVGVAIGYKDQKITFVAAPAEEVKFLLEEEKQKLQMMN